MDNKVRIQKYLSESGVCSRRAAEKLILAGEVSVNGKVVRELGTKIDPETDSLIVSGDKISGKDKVLYIFHKPRGIITTLDDPQGRPCIGDSIESLPTRVYPVGRLDTDVSGLLLLTNDGEFANRLLHPKFSVPRVYWAICRGKVERSTLERLCRGIELVDGVGRFKEAEFLEASKNVKRLLGVLPPDHTYVRVVADEGRKHFVKKMFKTIDHRIFRLSRVEFGPYKLGNLKEGGIRRVERLALE